MSTTRDTSLAEDKPFHYIPYPGNSLGVMDQEQSERGGLISYHGSQSVVSKQSVRVELN